MSMRRNWTVFLCKHNSKNSEDSKVKDGSELPAPSRYASAPRTPNHVGYLGRTINFEATLFVFFYVSGCFDDVNEKRRRY